MKLLALVLLTAGILALVYKGFTYTKETHETKIGPIDIRYDEKEHVDIPMWAGVILVVAGGSLLACCPRKSCN
ncbi:MAG: hypothetical protein FD180_2740 [Planctomycetota bacterium]|nr:MAG: hypothetical protein FD180_2740 [Planctomycetota bacterium]